MVEIVSDQTEINLVQPVNPHQALGFAVEYLMRAPSFANRSFGAWSRILMGQINRKHYVLARVAGRTVGFVGFARCTDRVVDEWFRQRHEPTSTECLSGPIVLINAWMADDTQVSAALRIWMQTENSDAETVVAKRIYESGRVRPLRLPLRRHHADHGI